MVSKSVRENNGGNCSDPLSQRERELVKEAIGIVGWEPIDIRHYLELRSLFCSISVIESEINFLEGKISL